jgi:mono/diheme cytochrome c family protein
MKYFSAFYLSVSALLVLACGSLNARAEPELTLKTPEKTLVVKRSQLLSKKKSAGTLEGLGGELTTLVVENDPAYGGKTRSYQAVPVYSLFKWVKIREGEVLLYRCLDGFSAAMASDRLLNQAPDKAIAYLAIEPAKKWPQLAGKTVEQTAGPFYLIWKNPQLSQINREEWPYQVTGFEVKKSLPESYPEIFPDAKMNETTAVGKGFKVFTQVCFNCHTMNLQGESRLGPDLNFPMNPIEYYKDGILKAFVRNPKSVRDWPTSVMPPIPKEVVSDAELEQLEEYLRHMSGRKIKAP